MKVNWRDICISFTKKSFHNNLIVPRRNRTLKVLTSTATTRFNITNNGNVMRFDECFIAISCTTPEDHLRHLKLHTFHIQNTYSYTQTNAE